MKSATAYILTGLLLTVFAIETPAQVTETTNREELRKIVRDRGSVRIIVTYRMEGFTRDIELNQGQRDQQRRSIAAMHDDFVRHITTQDFKVYHVGRKMVTNPRIALRVDEEALEYLFNSRLVERIEQVRMYRLNRSQSTSIIGSFNANTHFDITGNDQTVVIIDTGVDYTHDEFGSRVVDGGCFSTHDPGNNIEALCPYYGDEFDTGVNAGKECTGVNGCDHGTHVAGIMAGGNGVAPSVDIISIQVFSKIDDPDVCNGSENTPCITILDPDLEAALERVYTNYWTYDPVAVNLSLGDKQEYSAECDTLGSINSTITSTIEDLIIQGTAVVAASGNESYGDGAA